MIVGLAPATDLRAVLPSSTFVDLQQAATISGLFYWDSASVAPDNGATVLIPNDIIAPAPGRWLKIPLSVPPGAGDLYFTLSGNYSAVPTPGTFDAPFITEVAFTLDHVHVARRTAGTAGQTTIDVTKNGVSIFAGGPPFVAAAAGDYATAVGNLFAPGSNVFAPGDILEVVLTSVETFNAGPPPGPEGLRVTIVRV
jgi:hypothetical protein